MPVPGAHGVNAACVRAHLSAMRRRGAVAKRTGNALHARTAGRLRRRGRVAAVILYLDCGTGASGDMLASSLCALAGTRGIDGAAVVREALAAAGIAPEVASFSEVRRGGLAATAFGVQSRPGFAQLRELEQTVVASRLPTGQQDRVIAVTRRLAAAESAAHGGRQQHVHELSDIDTAVDLIAVVALVAALAPDRVSSSPPALGGGFVQTAHGRLPVPAPAVLALLDGLPTAGGEEGMGELTTPTGAALLAELVDEFSALPAGRIAAVGIGAGGRELPGRANVLRAILVEPLTAEDAGEGEGQPAVWSLCAGGDSGLRAQEVQVLAATIDDMSPEHLAAAADALRAAGALDAWSLPAVMKKGRPGVVLQALCEPERLAAVAEVFFRTTSTFGLRVQRLDRLVLADEECVVDVSGETVRVRLGRLGGELITVSPEHDDCARAGERLGLPARIVHERAQAAARAACAAAPPPAR